MGKSWNEDLIEREADQSERGRPVQGWGLGLDESRPTRMGHRPRNLVERNAIAHSADTVPPHCGANQGGRSPSRTPPPPPPPPPKMPITMAPHRIERGPTAGKREGNDPGNLGQDTTT